jgi:copper transport protein
MLLLMFPGTASAHNEFVSSSPSEGDVVTTVPEYWEVVFTKSVPLNSATAEIVNAEGIRTQLTELRHGTTDNIVQFMFPDDINGAITSRWKLVSDDGHVVQGRVGFTVTAPISSTNGQDSPNSDAGNVDTPVIATTGAANDAGSITSPAPEFVRWGVRSFGFAAVMAIGGLLFVQQFLANGTLSTPRGLLISRYATSALVISPLLQNLFLVGDIRDTNVFAAIPHFFSSFDITAGAMFTMQIVIGGVLVYLMTNQRLSTQDPFVSRILLSLFAMYLIALAFIGHSKTMAWPLLGIPADISHTIAAAVWLGGLAVIVFVLSPVLSTEQLISTFRNFGTYAQYAVIALLVTGVIQTLRLHGDIVSLFTESHGRILILKIIVVAVMLKIADINRRRMLRNMTGDTTPSNRRVTMLVRASTTEIATGGLVIAITAVLVNASFS